MEDPPYATNGFQYSIIGADRGARVMYEPTLSLGKLGFLSQGWQYRSLRDQYSVLKTLILDYSTTKLDK